MLLFMKRSPFYLPLPFHPHILAGALLVGVLFVCMGWVQFDRPPLCSHSPVEDCRSETDTVDWFIPFSPP
jgi:hypothetical protein